MASSVDGLISGLSTSQLISQLMQVEAAPQTKLKSTLNDEQTIISSYQAVNSKMSALKTAAEALNTSTGWQVMKATASSDAVTVTAGASAITGQLSFNVTNLAQAQVSAAAVPTSGDVVDTNGITINIGTGDSPVSTNIPLSDIKTNTPQGVADAINAKGLAVRATVVTTGDGTTLLQFSSTKTGLANSFTVDGLLGDQPHNVFDPQDATITVGDPNAGGYTITSTSNTFNNVVPGVTVTALKETGTTPVTVAVSTDNDKLADKMQALVDATNAALTSISSQSQYDPDTKTGGPLLADSTTRFMAQRLLSAVSNGKSGYGSFSQLGVSLDQAGQLTFDRNKFLAALDADPDKVQDAVANGLATTMAAEGKKATDIVDGSLTLAIQGGNDKVKDLNDRIADWDVRLKTRQDALQRQFSNLEVALGKLKDQSQWLSGQIASLPTAASNS